MGLYLRKSFRFGPVRLNLSKSGVGVSVGVKGLRVGTGPRGSYLHAGRRGLYLRESLEAASPELSAADSPVPTEPSPSTDSIAETSIQEGPTPGTVHLHVKREWDVLVLVAVMAGGIFWILFAVSAQTGVAFTLLPPALAVGIFITIPLLRASYEKRLIARVQQQDCEYEKRLNQYLDKLFALFELKPPLPLDRVAELVRIRSGGRFKPEDLSHFHATAYCTLVMKVIKDGVFEDKERGLLEQMRRLLQLSASDAREIFRLLYLRMVADHELSEAEGKALNHVRHVLAIPDEAIQEELQTIVELQRVRAIREGDLRQIPVDINLQDKEICYHRTTGKVLEKQILRSYTLDRVRHNEEGLVPKKEGDLYVTSRRLLFVGDGATSIPLEKLLDVEVDADAKLLTLVTDGRQKPIYLEVPDTLVTGAVIERASQKG